MEKIIDKLSQTKTDLKFNKEYVADDLIGYYWIKEALKKEGFKICRKYMKKVGMKGVVDQFKELQKHYRVEVGHEENKKIALLQKAAQLLGFPDDEIKEVWIFIAENEKNIFTGQYNSMFYWLSKEFLSKSFFDCLNVYIHEAAHKDGPHGEAKFEYGLEQRKQKITQFILEHRDEWNKIEQEWKSINKG